MKKILATLVVLLSTCIVQAESPVKIVDITIPQNGQGTLVIQFKFAAEGEYTGYSMSLVLPDGISIAKNEKDKFVYTLGDCHEDTHQLTINYDEAKKVFSLGCLSLESDPLIGTSGILLSLPVVEDGNHTAGSVLHASAQEINFGKLNGQTDSFVDVVAFDITIGEPDDGRIKFDENATTLPTYTAGEKGNVRMTRAIKAGQWSTIVLPFTLTKAKAEAAFGSDVELAEFSGFETQYSDEEDVSPDAITVNFTTYTMTAKKGMSGGKPFLIKTAKDVESFEADDVTLVDGITDVVKSDEYDTSGRFTGSFVKTKVPADGLFINNNLFWYSTGKTSAKAFRGWFMLGAVLDKDTDFGVKMVVRLPDGDAVEEVQTEERENGAIYDLCGRRIEKAGKGIFIINNKKVLVK